MHEIDLGIWYAGLSVTRVAAFSGNYSDIGIEAPDLAEILIDFSGAVMASVHLDFFQHPRRRVTELICTRGVVTVEFAQWNRCTVSSFDATAREWRRINSRPTATTCSERKIAISWNPCGRIGK